MRRFAAVASLACGIALALPGTHVLASETRPRVLRLSLTGVVDPFIASYVEAGLRSAADERFDAVLLTIDTPGGLDSAMREIVKAVLASPVPVICYTAPAGARAASAGTFVMLACPVNAMAPGTNIGAAHPVGVSGAIEQEKVTNDAAAFIRSLAERWDRNARWAEKAVRESVSIPSEEAARIGVVDVVAASTANLLRVVDGRTVTVAGGRPVVIRTAGAAVEERPMAFGARLLHGAIDPNLAFLFFFVGLVLVVVELLHPGVSVPGILGVLLLVTAFASFGALPVELAGVVLLLASAVFFLLELKHPGIGLPTLGGISALVLGGLFLYDTSVPNARVSPLLIAALAVGLGLFFTVVVKAALSARRLPPAAGRDALVGTVGSAVTALDPVGTVRAGGETWTAESLAGPIPAGADVRIVQIKGLRLVVDSDLRPLGATSAREEGGS